LPDSLLASWLASHRKVKAAARAIQAQTGDALRAGWCNNNSQV
jgi:hypothetical protein